MRFELTIPPDQERGNAAIVTVDAANWLQALSKALTQLGASQIPKGKAVCEVKHDGSILVRNAADGRQFFIRPLPSDAPPAAVVEPLEPPRPTPFGTMTYLEAQLAQNAPYRGARPLNPNAVRDASTGAHPCMVLDRAEIERRLAQQQEARRKARQNEPVAPARLRRDNTAEQPVKFIRVVEVEQMGSDTLTSLRVDLDMLRRAQAKSPGRASSKRPPAGYEWLQDPLDAALQTARTPADLASRSLRITLAALPSRLAMLFVTAGGGEHLRLFGRVGQQTPEPPEAPLPVAGTPFHLVLTCGMSMAVDRSPTGPCSTRELAAACGYVPEAALLAAVTDGAHTIGTLLLADSLTGPRYGSADLAVASYLGFRLFGDLEYWTGSNRRARTT